MSVESTYKNRLDINLNRNKPLQSTLSQREHIPVSHHSLKSPSRESYRQERSKSRPRTLSGSSEPTKDTITELTSTTTSSNKDDHQHDRRCSELKPMVERHDHTSVDRRNSIPQLHLSSLFPNPFRNQKHHNKPNTK